jgi:hypothetical protein
MCHSEIPTSRIYLGQRESVAEKLCEWLSLIDYGKSPLIEA